MTDTLTVYNLALRKLKERKIASLSESREARRILDDLWTTNVNYCLEQALWLFAQKVVQIDASTTVVPAFGFNDAFALPSDWIRTVIVSTAPALDPPLTQYKELTGFIYANFTPLYLAYISSDVQYGYNLGAWPNSFTDFVACRLAKEAAPSIVKSDKMIEMLDRAETRARRISKANDAMNEGAAFPPVSFWVRSRRGAFQSGMPVPGSGND